MNFRRHSIILIILLAVIVRLIALHWQDTQQLTGGEDRAIAQSLIDGQGFSFQQFNYFGPTSIRPPIYPFVLFGIFSIFGSGSAGPMVAVMLNLTAAAISVAAAYRLGINLFRKRAMAQLFAILLALWPGQIVAAGYYQGLTLATCFLLLSLTMITSPRNSRAPLAGIFAGLAVMTESILLLPVAAIYLWISSLKPARAITALVATVCLIVPWLYRNYIVHDQLTGITNTLWTDIYLGNGPEATGSMHLDTFDYAGKPLTRLDLASPMALDQLKKQPESHRNEIFQQWSIRWIEENLGSYFQLSLKRIAKVVWLDWSHSKALNPLNLVPRTIATLGLLTATSLFLIARRRRNRTFNDIPTIDPMNSARAMYDRHSESTEPLRLSPVTLSVVLMIALVLSSVLTMAEARNAVFVDVAQLLAVVWLVDKKREA